MPSDITPDEVRALLEEAMALAPGEWDVEGQRVYSGDLRLTTAIGFGMTPVAAFIAAAPSIAALALEQADTIERLRAVAEAARVLVDHHLGVAPIPDDYRPTDRLGWQRARTLADALAALDAKEPA